MKILNLYAGIGGNRKLWGDEHEITAVEINQDIANIYKDYYSNDNVIVGNAHDYLLEHFKDYDFIWSSPPCPTHSVLNFAIKNNEKSKYNKMRLKYPDMTLYQEIIILKTFCKSRWVIENVKPYYSPLIEPSVFFDRHLFWSNFIIHPKIIESDRRHKNIEGGSTVYGYNISDYKCGDKRKILRNMVNPEIGKYILECAMYKGELF